MSELNLPACPICQSWDSLSRQSRTVQNSSYVWYECQWCGSVLLQAGTNRWTFQKVGRTDKSHLLKQTLTTAELQDMVSAPPPPIAQQEPDIAPQPWESWAEPEGEIATQHRPEPALEIEPPEERPAVADWVNALRPEPVAQQPELAPAPGQEAEAEPPRRFPRGVVLAIIVLTLCVLVSLALLIVVMMINRQGVI